MSHIRGLRVEDRMGLGRLVCIAVFAALALLVVAADEGRAPGSPTVWTDKPEYYPGEIVKIFGGNFTANANVTVNVARSAGDAAA